MKRTAKVEAYKDEYGAGWKVICSEDGEVLHTLYISNFSLYGADLAFRVAMSRAEMWVCCGVALSFPIVGQAEALEEVVR